MLFEVTFIFETKCIECKSYCMSKKALLIKYFENQEHLKYKKRTINVIKLISPLNAMH